MELDTILKTSEQEKYERARKRVDAIKGFHKHITAYIIVNFFFLIIKTNIMSAFADRKFDWNFDAWLQWNTWGTLVLWGIGLTIHGLYVYRHKFKFLKNWEERKIKEFMDEDNTNNWN